MNIDFLLKLRNMIISTFAILWGRKMTLKGGVLIIGSLLWDNSNRREWRERSLETLDAKISIPVRIRYGRESSKNRENTYTMIFSNHQTTGWGQGYIVRLIKNIENEEMFKDQAIALAKAEGIWTDNYNGHYLGKNWGAVGLLVNENKPSADLIKSIWMRLFQEFKCDNSQCGYDPAQFCIENEC